MLIFKLRAFVFERNGTGDIFAVGVTFVQCKEITMQLEGGCVSWWFYFLIFQIAANFKSFFLCKSYQYQIDGNFDKLASIFIYKSSALFDLFFTAKAP